MRCSQDPRNSINPSKQAEFGGSWPHTNLSHWCRLTSTFCISCRGVGSVSQGAVGTRLAGDSGSQWQRLKYKAEHHWSNSWALEEQPYLQEERRHPPPTDTEWPTEEKFRCLDYEPQESNQHKQTCKESPNMKLMKIRQRGMEIKLPIYFVLSCISTLFGSIF